MKYKIFPPFSASWFQQPLGSARDYVLLAARLILLRSRDSYLVVVSCGEGDDGWSWYVCLVLDYWSTSMRGMLRLEAVGSAPRFK